MIAATAAAVVAVAPAAAVGLRFGVMEFAAAGIASGIILAVAWYRYGR